MAGFGKSKSEQVDKFCKIPSNPTETSCSCGSGKSYSDCCLPFHERKTTVEIEPSAFVRSRFSAFVYGLTKYIMDSTHPSNKDFATEDDISDKPSKRSKRQIWDKAIRNFAEEFEFANLSFDNEIEDNRNAINSDLAIVSIKLQRRLRGAINFDFIEEKIRLKKGVDGAWLYLGSEMTNKGSPMSPSKPQRMVTGSAVKTGIAKS
eukprot:gene26324-34953_t